MGLNLAVSHAFLGTSFVAVVKDGQIDQIQRLRDNAAKEAFLMSLKPGDQVFLEMGGAGDKIALMATKRGAQVQRVPTFVVGNDKTCDETVSTAGWLVDEESPHGKETGAVLTERKTRALAIAALSIMAPELFTEQLVPEQEILMLQMYYRTYRTLQKTLLGNYLRLVATYKDLYLLEAVSVDDDLEALSKDKVSVKVVQRVMAALLITIPENQRQAFAAQLGLDKLQGKHTIPRKKVDDMLREIVDKLLESDVMSPFVQAMAEQKKSIEKLLKSMAVYRAVFEPIPGVGPLIAARMIGSIGDIRRFQTLPNLVAYAGYHQFEDGTRARRVAGRVSNWNMGLKQAVYLWTQQALKMPKSPWRAKLDLRRAYEIYKILCARQATAKEQALEIQILPVEFVGRQITSVNDMTPVDLPMLLVHVDALRKQAGIKPGSASTEEDEAETEEVAAKNPALAKLVRGVKMQALQKAQRWLGQQILKHIFKGWRKHLGLAELPVREPKRAVA